MIKSLLTVVSVLLFSAAFAQDDLLVTIKSDTIRGEIRMTSYDLIDRVDVKQGKKKTTYTALQVRRVVSKGVLFAPVKLENSIRFMKVIKSGSLSLYYYRSPQQTGFDTKVIQKIGTEAIEVPNLGFKKIIAELVAECPAVSDKIKSGEYGKAEIEAIAEEYNQCILGVNAARLANANAATASSPAIDLVDKLKTKVANSDISNKTDAAELLNSISDRLRKQESIPAYMKEGLKGYLSGNADLKADLDQLLTLIEK